MKYSGKKRNHHQIHVRRLEGRASNVRTGRFIASSQLSTLSRHSTLDAKRCDKEEEIEVHHMPPCRKGTPLTRDH